MVDLHTQKIMKTIIRDRVNSLLDDGYILLFRASDMQKFVYRLRHRTNGNQVTLYVYYSRNWLQQYSNGKITYNAPIWSQLQSAACP